MGVSQLKIGRTKITFVFRHRFERYDNNVETFRSKMEWRGWEIGLWYRPSKIVGDKNFNLVKSYMIGINLLIFKAWVEFNRGGMKFPT